MPRRVSQPFLAAVAGLSITAVGLLSSLRWPLWPVDWILDALGIADPYGDAAGARRAVLLSLLILVNALIWAVAIYASSFAIARGRKQSARGPQ